MTWPALGTTAVLVTTGDQRAASRAASREIRRIDAAANRFDPTSELSRLNRAPGVRVEVTPTLFEALELALRAAALTDGAVDPTLGERLVALGYDRDFAALEPADPGEPLARTPLARTPLARAPPASARDGLWRAVELWDDPPAARIPAGVQLDLGATAKALAADRGARAASRAAGGAGVLLSLGGDTAVSGVPPADGWLIRVTDDHRDQSGTGQRVTIHTGAVATSSLTARRWRHRGRTLHHVLDPATGEPTAPVWRTVSVAAATCADANIATTAALVLGARAPRWLAERALPSRLVALDGTVQTQCGWPG